MAEKKVTVEVVQSMSGPVVGSFIPGDDFTTDAAEATRLIEAGIAKAKEGNKVKTKRRPKAKPKAKATARKGKAEKATT